MVAGGAYDVCLRIARQHYENFPVASRLLPAAWRPHLAAVYAFARIADDFADEGAASPETRIASIDRWHTRLLAAAAGPLNVDGSDETAVFIALSETMRVCALEVAPFEDLLSAFRQDVVVTRYETWETLLEYCRRSANPVGRIVLRIAGYRDRRLDEASDALCTALQLTNFWQDLERDFQKGRVYLPRELMRAAGAEEADLAARRVTAAWRSALADAAGRTRRLFDAGRPVVDGVRGRLRWELRATWLGGRRVLDRTEAAGFDVFHRRPRIGWSDAALIGCRMLAWR